MISDWALLQSNTELMQWFIWALLLFSLMFYANKVRPSCFLSLYEVLRILRGLPYILVFRVHIVPAHLFALCFDRVFALTI